MYIVSGINFNSGTIKNAVLKAQHVKPVEQQTVQTENKMYSNAKSVDLETLMTHNSDKKVDMKYIASAFHNAKMFDIPTKQMFI